MKKSNGSKVLLFISSFIIVLPTLVFGYLDKPTIMGIYVVAGFLGAVILNIDKFESFKAGQIEAKLTEVEKVIDEANVTIDQLKQLNEPLMNYVLSHIINFNKPNGVTAKEKENILYQIELNANQFDIKNEQFITLLQETKREIARNYLFELDGECNKVSGTLIVGSWKADLIQLTQRELLPNEKEIRDLFERDEDPDLHERNPRDVINEKIKSKVEEYLRFYNKHFAG